MTDTNKIQTRLDAGLIAWLTGRASRMHGGTVPLQARTELELWRMTLDSELVGIRMTVGEVSCVADVLNGTLIAPSVSRPGRVYAECYDAFRLARLDAPDGVSAYGAKWGIDERALLTYLGTLGPAADHALADAIARWWDQDLDATAGGFAKVGITVRAPS